MVVQGSTFRHASAPGYGRLALFFVWFLLPAACVRAEVTVPQSGDYVVDAAGVIDAQTKAEIESWLAELEQKTTAQVKVLTVKSDGGEDFFGFVQRHYDLWKLGKKGKSNGALIALAVQEHKVRIHTGYGLEGVLPDSWSGSLSRSVVHEYFKRGAYADGLKHMVIVVANRIADDAGVKLGTPQIRHHDQQPANNPLATLVVVLLMILFYYLYWRQSRMGRGGWGGYGGMVGPFSTSSYGGGGWNGSFGGGSSGGGSFGGGSWGGGGESGGGGGGASW
jgi:uncharacterized protein